jgi:WD40 repeat protein
MGHGGRLGCTFVHDGSRGVVGLAFDPVGELLAAAGEGYVQLWDVVSRLLPHPRQPRLRGGVRSRGRHAGRGGRQWPGVRVDMVTGARVGTFADPASRGVNGVAFAPAGDQLAVADGNGCTYLWKTSAYAT